MSVRTGSVGMISATSGNPGQSARSDRRWRRSVQTFVALAGICSILSAGSLFAAEPPPVDLTMKFRPAQSDVEYDIPEPKQYPQCKVNVFREGKVSGWMVVGPNGLLIRRFTDSNGDDLVDQWSFFRNGLEVYRDIDTNKNNKPDQSRWLNIGGLRWGVDANEDGKIDEWKMISAEEVSKVAVRALVTQDAQLLAPLLVGARDLQSLDIDRALAAKILESVADPAGKLKKAAQGSKILSAKTTWLRFDGSAPSVIPADQLNTPRDVFVYENVMAIVDAGGGQPGLIQIGELVRVGDVWKMTSIPAPLEGNQVTVAPGGMLMEPAMLAAAVAAAGPDAPGTGPVSPELQKLFDQLREIDEKAPTPASGKTEIAKYTKTRLKLLETIRAKSPDDADNWTRQMVDSITAAVQLAAYPDGIAELKQIAADVSKSNPKSPLIPYIEYRVLVSDYSEQMHAADNEGRQKIQTEWLTTLEKWVVANPRSEDASNAAQQLAVALEFGGKSEKAKDWYEKIVTDYAKSPEAERARGALTRLNLVGKPLVLAGPALKGGTVDIKQYRNKIVLVVFWNAACKECTLDLPELKALYEKYNSGGFEILGVNLDVDAAAAQAHVQQHKVPWNHVVEGGGFDAPAARQFGVISLPTMFVVNSDGLVYKNSSSVTDLKAALSEAFDKKPDTTEKKAAAAGK
jgi:peroxiredoxin